MRIISQGGKIDLPYEQISISIDCDDERTIIAYAVSSGTIWELAEYSKKEKAEKAMEMLRTEYGNYKQAKAVNIISLSIIQKSFGFRRIARCDDERKCKMEG